MICRVGINGLVARIARHRCGLSLLVFLAWSLTASALTVRTKADLRYWQTVFDRSERLSWVWHDDADSALLTFSNCLSQVVTSQTVFRDADAARGDCELPVPTSMDDALVEATLAQACNGNVVSCEKAALAFVRGVLPQSGGTAVATSPITVLTKTSRTWERVARPRLSAFDASWWHSVGPSGYEVMWHLPIGWHRVERAFDDVGVVSETMLKFGTPGLRLSLR